jgi:hypothetical protein
MQGGHCLPKSCSSLPKRIIGNAHPTTVSTYLYSGITAAKPTKHVDITLHFLELLPMAFCCLLVPLAVALMLLPRPGFPVKLIS